MSFAATATTRSSSSRLDARRTFRPMIDWSGLDAAIAGDVVQPSDPDWDAARQAWNLAADQHPAVVVRAAARADLVATVRFAGANGLRVAPQSTGHGAPVLGDLSDAILLRTGGLTGVAVDPGARTARVQSGTPWRQVVETAGEHGLACLHGMSGGVGGCLRSLASIRLPKGARCIGETAAGECAACGFAGASALRYGI